MKAEPQSRPTGWPVSQGGGKGQSPEGTKTQVQHTALLLADADVHGSCTGLQHGTRERKQLLLITPLAWALLQTQIYVKPLNIFHHLLCFILNLLKNHLKLKDDASKLQASYTGVCQGSSLSTHCTGRFRGVSLRFHGLRKTLQSAEMGSVPLVGEQQCPACPKSKTPSTTEGSSIFSRVIAPCESGTERGSKAIQSRWFN